MLLSSQEFVSVATSPHAGSVALDDADFLSASVGPGVAGPTELVEAGRFSRVALWFGHEGLGLSADALAAAHATVHMPMFGSGDSLGVSAAVPVVIHEVPYQPFFFF